MHSALATQAPTPIKSPSKPHPASDYFSGSSQRQTARTTDLDALLKVGTAAYPQHGGQQALETGPQSAAAVDAMYDPMDGIGIALGLRSALLFNACLGLGGFLAYEAWMFLAH